MPTKDPTSTTPPPVYQAIQTKLLGPTNFRGSRVSAQCESGRVIVDWDHRLGSEENHRHAAEVLAKKLNWLDDGYHGQMYGGSLRTSYVWRRETT